VEGSDLRLSPMASVMGKPEESPRARALEQPSLKDKKLNEHRQLDAAEGRKVKPDVGKLVDDAYLQQENFENGSADDIPKARVNSTKPSDQRARAGDTEMAGGMEGGSFAGSENSSERLAARREYNRICAAKSRDKKRKTMGGLEQNVEDVNQLYQDRKLINTSLWSEIEHLLKISLELALETTSLSSFQDAALPILAPSAPSVDTSISAFLQQQQFNRSNLQQPSHATMQQQHTLQQVQNQSSFRQAILEQQPSVMGDPQELIYMLDMLQKAQGPR